MREGQLKCDTGVIRADVMTPGSFNCVGVGEPCLPVPPLNVQVRVGHESKRSPQMKLTSRNSVCTLVRDRKCSLDMISYDSCLVLWLQLDHNTLTLSAHPLALCKYMKNKLVQ